MDSVKINIRLSNISLITTLGDFISQFALLVLIHNISGSIAIASLIVPYKGLGMALGSLSAPWVINRLAFRKTIIISQILSGSLLLTLTLFFTFGVEPSVLLILIVTFFESVFKRYFDVAQESFSKAIGTKGTHLTLQAKLLQGFYSAQFVGPVMSFFLVQFLPLQVPLWIDSISFFVASGIALRLPEVSASKAHSILNPRKVLFRDATLTAIFLVRSVGLWIPITAFNYFLFSVMTEHYGFTAVSAAWIYAIIGLGSVVSALLLQKPEKKASSRNLFERYIQGFQHWVHQYPETKIAFFATIVIGLSRVAFVSLPNVSWAVFFVFIGGICNGANAITTRSILRKVIHSDQLFTEVVALDLTVGKSIEYLLGSFLAFLFSTGRVTYSQGIWISAVSFWLLAPVFLLPVLQSNSSLAKREKATSPA